MAQPLQDRPCLGHATRRQALLGMLAGLPTSLVVTSAAVPVFATHLAAAERDTATASKSQAARNGLLVRPEQIDCINTRSKIALELDGKLQIEEPDPAKQESIRSAEVRAKSTLEYHEKIARQDDRTVAAARRYAEASVENWVSGRASKLTLRDECRETRLMPHRGIWQQYCESGTLTAREAELLRAPINSAVIELLLPSEPAKPSQSWELSPQDAALLFNLDAVHSSTVSSQIAKVDKGKATIELEGELNATANSVPTLLKIRGNYRVELGKQCAVITWLGLVVEEDREISQAIPGFSITARIRMIRTETDDVLNVSADKLQKLASQDDEGRWLVQLDSQPGNFSMLADRRWTTFMDGGEETILRMIENDTVIAQCNISRLNKFAAGQQLTLEGFQADIKQSLGDTFESFLESREQITSAKLKLMRTAVIGQREGVPIQWIYAHISDDTGRRVALIYTMGGNVTDRFAAADEQMTNSFQFLSTASEPTTIEPENTPKLTATPQEAKR